MSTNNRKNDTYNFTSERMKKLSYCWKTRRALAISAWASQGVNIHAEVCDEDGNYTSTEYEGKYHPFEFAVEFRKVNATDDDIGFSAATTFTDGKLRVEIVRVLGPPKKANVCSEGVCGCEEDPC